MESRNRFGTNALSASAEAAEHATGKYPNGIVFQNLAKCFARLGGFFLLDRRRSTEVIQSESGWKSDSNNCKVGAFFKEASELPLDEERMRRAFEALVSRGPDGVNVNTSRAATPLPKKWSENLNIAYDIILQSEDGLTDEEAGESLQEENSELSSGLEIVGDQPEEVWSGLDL